MAHNMECPLCIMVVCLSDLSYFHVSPAVNLWPDIAERSTLSFMRPGHRGGRER